MLLAMGTLHIGQASLSSTNGPAQCSQVHRCPHGWNRTFAPASQHTTHSASPNSASALA